MALAGTPPETSVMTTDCWPAGTQSVRVIMVPVWVTSCVCTSVPSGSPLNVAESLSVVPRVGSETAMVLGAMT